MVLIYIYLSDKTYAMNVTIRTSQFKPSPLKRMDIFNLLKCLFQTDIGNSFRVYPGLMN
jgi:hypothetical protein